MYLYPLALLLLLLPQTTFQTYINQDSIIAFDRDVYVERLNTIIAN
jgi:hypothetical protein